MYIQYCNAGLLLHVSHGSTCMISRVCLFIHVGQLVIGRGIWTWQSVSTMAAHIPAGQGFTEPHCMELWATACSHHSYPAHHPFASLESSVQRQVVKALVSCAVGSKQEHFLSEVSRKILKCSRYSCTCLSLNQCQLWWSTVYVYGSVMYMWFGWFVQCQATVHVLCTLLVPYRNFSLGGRGEDCNMCRFGCGWR